MLMVGTKSSFRNGNLQIIYHSGQKAACHAGLCDAVWCDVHLEGTAAGFGSAS